MPLPYAFAFAISPLFSLRLMADYAVKFAGYCLLLLSLPIINSFRCRRRH